ncbi:hypothetical protein AXFE_09370 [Acidithrix ferrooxidans]|uniref:Uncharacterized protein n=1 Tax=Acidithrix ferrooxidans TaxID=1280514 RepID=A0A0D8HM79_9ACTN|nr:hypothetical protein AXFE_09370 [Acidithrix ferrooxidans]
MSNVRSDASFSMVRGEFSPRKINREPCGIAVSKVCLQTYSARTEHCSLPVCGAVWIESVVLYKLCVSGLLVDLYKLVVRFRRRVGFQSLLPRKVFSHGP